MLVDVLFLLGRAEVRLNLNVLIWFRAIKVAPECILFSSLITCVNVYIKIERCYDNKEK